MIPFYLLFLAFLMLDVWYYKHLRGRVFLFILLIYTFASFISVIYVNSEYFKIRGYQKHEFTYFPFFFWILAFWLLCSPIISYDKLRLSRLQFSEELLNYICIFGALLSVPVLFELVPQSTNILGASDLASTFSDIHNDDERNANFSVIGSFCFKVLSSAYELYILCFIPVLISPRKRKLRLLSLSSVVLTIVLCSMVISSRGSILATIINFVLLYFITYPFLDKHKKKEIVRFLFVLISIPVFLFVIITIARSITYNHNDSDKTLFTFLMSYTGEGFANFNQYMMHLKSHTNGDYCFLFLKKILGINEVDIVNRQFMYGVLEAKLGIPSMRFYTFMGFFVADIGFIGTFVFFLIISKIIKKIVVSKNGIFTFHSLYLLFVFSSVIANGTCIYRYTWNNSTKIFVILLIYAILKNYSVMRTKNYNYPFFTR